MFSMGEIFQRRRKTTKSHSIDFIVLRLFQIVFKPTKDVQKQLLPKNISLNVIDGVGLCLNLLTSQRMA